MKTLGLVIRAIATIPAIYLALCTTTAASQSASPDRDGYWGGAMRIDSWRVEAQMSVADGYGELTFHSFIPGSLLDSITSGQTTLPEPFMIGGEESEITCQYFLNLVNSIEAPKSILNTGSGNPRGCPREPGIRLLREEEKIILLIDAETIRTEIGMFSALRPLVVDELATLPDRFDVLGVKPGMSIKDARTVLAEKGYSEYTLVQDPRISTDSWGQTVLTFVKGENTGSDQYPHFADSISIVPSTEARSLPHLPQQVMIVGRAREYGEDASAGVQLDTLKAALEKKYGAPSTTLQAHAPDRSYDFSGLRVENEAASQYRDECARASGQAVHYQTPFTFLLGENQPPKGIFAKCGSHAKVRLRQKGNLVKNFSVVLYSQPHLANDAWRRHHERVGTKARAQFKALGNVGEDAPEL